MSVCVLKEEKMLIKKLDWKMSILVNLNVIYIWTERKLWTSMNNIANCPTELAPSRFLGTSRKWDRSYRANFESNLLTFFNQVFEEKKWSQGQIVPIKLTHSLTHSLTHTDTHKRNLVDWIHKIIIWHGNAIISK